MKYEYIKYPLENNAFLVDILSFAPFNLSIIITSTAADHLTVQVNSGLAALLNRGLVEVSEVVVHQGADYAVLQGVDQQGPAHLAELEEVVIDVDLDGVFAGVSDLLDTGEPRNCLSLDSYCWQLSR